MSLAVAPLMIEDTAAVKRLLIDGLAERWGAYEPRFNPDIESLPMSYSGSLILVAKSAGIVVGTGTLRPFGDRKCEIVRMSTARASRRSGVASAVLLRLLDHARAIGTNVVVLETTTSWESAIAFYAKHGFVRTHERGGDTHFSYVLR